MATQKTKTVLSWIIAILVAIIAIRVFFYIVGAAFFLVFTMIKFLVVLFLLAMVAIPLYVVIRRMIIK